MTHRSRGDVAGLDCAPLLTEVRNLPIHGSPDGRRARWHRDLRTMMSCRPVPELFYTGDEIAAALGRANGPLSSQPKPKDASGSRGGHLWPAMGMAHRTRQWIACARWTDQLMRQTADRRIAIWSQHEQMWCQARTICHLIARAEGLASWTVPASQKVAWYRRTRRGAASRGGCLSTADAEGKEEYALLSTLNI